MISRRVLAAIWAAVLVLVLIHVAYIWSTKQLIPDTDILMLLPAGDLDPGVAQAVTRTIGSARQRIITLIGANDAEQGARAADAYRTVLAAHSDVFIVQDRTDGADAGTMKPFSENRLVLLTAEQETLLRSEPKTYWVETALNRLYTPFAGLNLMPWRDDPFGLFSGWVQARLSETPVRPHNGRLFVEKNGRTYFVLPFSLRPPAFSVATQETIRPLLAEAAEAARKATPDTEVLSAGIALHAAAASAQAQREISVLGAGSVAGILLLVWLTFNSWRPIALVFLSLMIGCLGALSVCWLLFRHIHVITLVFGASLIGVAQDYAIYFLCNLRHRKSASESIGLIQRILPALFLALLTTIIGYISLAVTPFPGLQQMAVFSVTGLLFAWLTVILWFPAVAGWAPDPTPRALSSSRLLSFGRRLRALPLRFIIAAAMAVLTFGLLHVQFEDDLRVLNNSPADLLTDQITINRLLDLPSPAQFFLVRGSSPQNVLEREETLRKRLDALVAKQAVGGYHAVSNWIPSLRLQQSRLALIDEKLLSADGALTSVAAALSESPDWRARTRDRLVGAATPLDLNDFLASDVTEPWHQLWLGDIGGTYASIVALRGVMPPTVPTLRNTAEGLSGVKWIDNVAEISSILARYRRYSTAALVASYLGIYLFLYPRYRNRAWRLLVPTALGSLITIALLGIAGTKLQIFHVMALMLLLGIGVDYSIFLEGTAKDDGGPWLAVSISAISTLLSFGLLSLSATPALHAFGLVMLIGTTIVWLSVPLFVSPGGRQYNPVETGELKWGT